MAKCFVCEHVLVTWEKAPQFADIHAAVKWVESIDSFEDWDLCLHRWKRGMRKHGSTFEWMILLMLKIKSSEDGRCANCERVLTELDMQRLLSDPVAQATLRDLAEKRGEQCR